MGILYIVSTPIGNLQDLTLRAAQTILSSPYVITESTSKTANLMGFIRTSFPSLTRMPNKPSIVSFSEDEEEQKLPQVIKILENYDAALVSEAGTPLVSDPGFKLVREAVKRGINIISIPGASAPIAALTTSGLPTDKFFFVGYLPKKDGKRTEILTKLLTVKNEIGTTLIFFESPHRLVESLKSILQVYGDIPIVITRELTKIHEEVRRELVAQSIEYFTKTSPKGEFVILI